MLPSLLLSGDRDGAVQGLGCLFPSIPPSPCVEGGLSPGVSSVTQGYVTRATTTSWWLGHGWLCAGHRHLGIARLVAAPAPHVHLPHRAIPTSPR